MSEHCPNLKKYVDIWIHKVQRLLIRFNPKKTSLRYNITVKDKRQREILESSKGKESHHIHVISRFLSRNLISQDRVG